MYQGLASDLQTTMFSVIISILVFKAVSVFSLQKCDNPEKWLVLKRKLYWFQVVFYSVYIVTKLAMIVIRIIKLVKIKQQEQIDT